MAGAATLLLNVVANTQQATAALRGVGTTARTTGGRLRGMGGALAMTFGVAAAAGVVAFGAKAVTAASDLSETVNKSNVVFGDSADEIRAWATNAATQMGLSEEAALSSAATFGDMFTQLGFGSDSAALASQKVVELASDLGSFHNVEPTEVLDRISSAFRGEYDSIQKLIPGITAARVTQEALRMSGKSNEKQLTASEKALAAYSIMMGDSTNAQDDFAETSGGLANQQRIAAAQTKDMSAALGVGLQPAVVAVMGVINDLLPIITAMFTFIAENIDWIAPLVAGLLAVAAVVKTWSIVQAILNSTLLANPIFLVIAAIAAIVAILIVAYRKSETFRRIVDGAMAGVAKAFDVLKNAAKVVFDWIKRNWPLLLAIITGPFGLAVLAIVKNWDTIKEGVRSAINWVKEKFNGLKDFFSGLVDSIGTIFGNIVDAIKAPINAVIDAWNNLSFTIPTFDLPDAIPGLPDKIGGATFDFPNIPRLAGGGRILRTGIALVHEGEVVTPKGRTPGGGSVYTLNIYPRRADAQDVAWGFRRLELLRTGR